MAIHDDHIDPRDALIAFLEYGRVSAEWAFRYHLHLFGQCAECTRRLLNHVGLASLEEVAAVRAPGVDLPALAARVELAPLVDWLESQPQAVRLRVAREEARFQRPAMVRQVLDRCRLRWSTDLAQAMRWSELALELLEQIPEDSLHDFFVGTPAELRALAWAYRGTVARLEGQLELGGYCFGRATETLGHGLSDELVRAEVLRLHSGLLRAQLRFEEAREAVAESAELYGCLCRWEEQGRALLSQAKLRCAVGEWEAGLRDLDRAVPALESSSDANAPSLLFAAALLRLRLLCFSGRHEEALACLPKAVARDVEGPAARLKLLWYEAAILAGLGRVEEAEPIYLLAWNEFRQQGCAYEAALVTVELVRIWLGRTVLARL